MPLTLNLVMIYILVDNDSKIFSFCTDFQRHWNFILYFLWNALAGTRKAKGAKHVQVAHSYFSLA